MMTTSCPKLDKCKAVGQPQKPSPPKTNTFMTVSFTVSLERLDKQFSLARDPGCETRAWRVVL